MIDSVYRTGKNYYLQVFVEERKYAIKKKMPEYITDDILPDDSDRKNSDEENYSEENFNEEKYRMHLLFIFLMSQMIYPYILLKNVVISKVTRVILGDLKSF